MRAVTVVALILMLAGCSDDAAKDGPSAQTPSAGSRRPAAVVAATAPQLKMASGTDAVDGVLARWCDGAGCKEASGVRPLRYLRAQPSGLLVFQAAAVPRRAVVEVRAGGRLLDRAPLSPGTTMAYAARGLAAEKYRVVVLATWPDREGRWVFGIEGPVR